MQGVETWMEAAKNRGAEQNLVALEMMMLSEEAES